MAAFRVRTFLLFGALLGGVALALLAGSGAAIPDPCQVTIEVGSSTLTAEVSSSEGATATHSGYVHFQKPPTTTATVNLTASTDNGLTITISPETASVHDSRDSTQVDFTFSVAFPAAAAAGDDGHATINARVSLNGFACTAPPPASVSLRVLPYVDVFGGHIPADSRHPAESGIGESFDIEVDVRSNAPMRVTFTYTMAGGMSVDGPAYIDFEPTFKFATTRAVRVSYHGDHLQAGSNGIDVFVSGVVDGLPPFTGHLGFLVLVPKAAPEPPGLNLTGVLVGLGLAAVVAGPVHLQQRRRERRRAAILRLKRIVADSKRAAATESRDAQTPISGRR